MHLWRIFRQRVRNLTQIAKSVSRTTFLPALTLISRIQLSIILEYIAGKVTDTLDRLIALYKPDSVVVGTRGRRSVASLSAAVLALALIC